MQAQNKALLAVHDWLRLGVDNPEVIIRAVQVLMADPERPSINKRPAVDLVFSILSSHWGSAGLRKQDVLILQGMILAAWPQELRTGGFALTPLLESAWVAIQGSSASATHVADWRNGLIYDSPTTSITASVHDSQTKENSTSSFSTLTAPNIDPAITTMHHNVGVNQSTQHTLNIIKSQNNSLNEIISRVNLLQSHILRIEGVTEKHITELSELARSVEKLRDNNPQAQQQNLLWWGQARYSSTLHRPYRLVTNGVERLWWMAWEGSQQAMGLDVEPAASFLIETLYQLTTQQENTKRPLKAWLNAFIEALRRIHSEEKHASTITVSARLKKLAEKDALGLPVTWARLEATVPSSATPLEERLRERCAVDPDVEIDLGDWAAWVFRESLLDRHLGAS